MTVKPPAPPPLPSELEQLLRRMRLPYIRRAAPEVIATATAQRWEHAEVLRVLLTEEAAGRDQATTRSATMTLPLVSGPKKSPRVQLTAPTQAPINIGIVNPIS